MLRVEGEPYTRLSVASACRVHTLGLPVTSVMGTVFRGADADSQVNFLGRRLAHQVCHARRSARFCRMRCESWC